MGKRIAFTIVTACVLLITGCGASNSAEVPAGADSQMAENAGQNDTGENIATDGVADYPAAIMVNDTVYLVEGNPMPTEVDESAIIGYTESYTGTFPENNGETNFNPKLGMPYAQVEGGIAVLYKNEWYLGTPLSNENAIAFTGIIIDHTVESLVPVVCVKTLEEEVIPYEAVFFELPEGEEDWALKIGAEVLITCSGDFTEPAPHYGTLISIHDGEYITGVFDEYNPETAIVNGKEVTEEEFKMWFDLAGLLDSSSIPRSRIKKDNGIVTAFVINVFQKSDEYIPVEDLDFNAVEW